MFALLLAPPYAVAYEGVRSNGVITERDAGRHGERRGRSRETREITSDRMRNGDDDGPKTVCLPFVCSCRSVVKLVLFRATLAPVLCPNPVLKMTTVIETVETGIARIAAIPTL